MAKALKSWIVAVIVLQVFMVSLSLGARPSEFMEMTGDRPRFSVRLSFVMELISALPKGSVTPSGPSTCTHYNYNGGVNRCPMKLKLMRGSLSAFGSNFIPPPRT